ncbi:MAG: hypothetical protein KGL39_59965, partial [Patescibacteria group bacterium]|nr:hypothetical protein [Patescibacteria group bacterium]
MDDEPEMKDITPKKRKKRSTAKPRTLPALTEDTRLPPLPAPKRVGSRNPKGTMPPAAGQGRRKGAVNLIT